MPIQTTTIKVFIGGPRDTKDDRAQVVDYIKNENEMSGRLPPGVKLEADCFDHPDHPVGVALEDDWQEKIDRRIHPGSQDFGIFLFRWKLGQKGDRNGKAYPSMTAYEIQKFIDSGRPLAIFRYDQPYDYRSRLPENFVLLSAEEQGRIAATLKREQEEYERLNDYLESLKTLLGKASIPRFKDSDQLRGLVHDKLRDVISSIADATKKSNFAEQKKQSTPPGWPFFSFRSLEEEHNDIFFGRDDDVRLILNNLKNPELQFLCIHGSSGTGKSSLLKAGILPALVVPELAAKNGIEYHPGTVHVVFNPDDRPFKKFTDRISEWKGTLLRGCDSAELADRLLESCHGEMEAAIDGVRRWLIDPALAGSPEGAQLILVIDQAEELWTRTRDERKPFLLFLVALVHHPQVRVLSTLRSDLYKDFTELELLGRLFNLKIGDFYQLFAPDEGMLAKMIEGPLRVAGIQRDDDLIGAILGDARKIAGDALPLVAHTLNIMVGDARGGRLTLEAYRKIGRLEGAVQAALGRVGKIPPEQLPPLFDLLYEIRGGAPFRRLVSRREIDCLDVNVSVALDKLTKARILVAGVSDAGRGKAEIGDNVQLAHDALFEVWPELREWVKQHRRDLVTRDELLRDAERWELGGRRSRYIRLRNEALEEVVALDREKPYLFRRNPVIGRYLEAANKRRLRELLIEYLKGRHLGAVLDTYMKGGRLIKEDRGDGPTQLVAAFHAAATGDDRADAQFFSLGEPVGFNSGPSVYDLAENVTKELSGGLVPLEVASMFGHLHLVQKLIKRGADPNRKAPNSGGTALSLAAYAGQLDVVRYFIEECQMDTNVCDRDNATPMLWALNRGHESVVQYLQEHGAQLDVRVRDALSGKTSFNALTEAVRGGNLNLVRKVMEEVGLDVDCESEIGVTPLSVACQQVEPPFLEIVKFLLDKGARIEGGTSGWRPLGLAAMGGSAEMIRLLLSRGANPNSMDNDGDTPLHCAAAHPSSKPILVLLDFRADPNRINMRGRTPLTIAASSGREETVELLLAHGAETQLTGKTEWTALQYVSDDGDVAIMRCLLEKGAVTESTTPEGWTPLLLAAVKGNYEAAALLLQHGANPNHSALTSGATALHLAAQNRQNAIAALLLGNKDFEMRLNLDGTSPLDLAALAGDLEGCSLLLDNGAQKSATRKDKLSALHLAVLARSEPVVHLLLERGADPKACGKAGLTALHLAAAKGVESIASLLLRKGADLSALAASLLTPKQLAAAAGHSAVVKLLAEAGATEEAEIETPEVAEEQFSPVPDGNATTLSIGAWETLSDQDAQQVLEDARGVLTPFGLSEQIVMRRAHLPFYKDFRLIVVTDENRPAPNRLRLLWKPGVARPLNWTNEPIYRTNQLGSIQLTLSTVAAYVEFFFANVHGALGEFDIVKSVEEVNWTEAATEEEKARLAEFLMPLTMRGFDEDGRFVLTCTVIFKNALFRTNVRVAPYDTAILDPEQLELESCTIGQLALTDEELLLEELNVPIDPPPTEPWA